MLLPSAEMCIRDSTTAVAKAKEDREALQKVLAKIRYNIRIFKHLKRIMRLLVLFCRHRNKRRLVAACERHANNVKQHANRNQPNQYSDGRNQGKV